MLRASLASLIGHRRRLVGTLVAIVAGTAFLSGTLVLGDTLRSSFDELFLEVNAGTDAVVRAPQPFSTGANAVSPPIDEAIGDELADLPGVAMVAPTVQGYGRLVGADGEPIGGNGPPTLAGAWIDDPDLNPYRIAEGRAPEADDEVIVNRGAADDGSLQVGDRTVVQMPTPVEVTIVGITTFGDQDGLGPTTWTAFSLPAAQRYILGGTGEVSSFAVEGEDGVDSAELLASIDAAIDTDLDVLSGAELSAENSQAINDDFLGIFTSLLVAFAAIGMFVATFSIHNTFSILVAQRTRESALLRAIGASRRQVFTATGIEAVILGLAGSLIGALTGLGVAAGLLGLFRAFGFPLPGEGLAVSGNSLVLAASVGVVATVIAAVSPAVRAARVAPLAALRDVSVEHAGGSRRRTLVGVALVAAGAAGVIAGGAIFGLGAVGVVIGFVVLGPVVARPVAGLLGAPLPRLRGITGALARDNATRNPSRTAGAATALVVGVGVVTLVTVMLASLSESTRASYEQAFGGDLAVASGRFQDPGAAGFDPALAAEVGSLPDVERALGIGIGQALFDGDRKELSITDPATAAAMLDLGDIEGPLAGLGGDGLAVSAATAESNGWGLGSRAEVTWPDGATDTLVVDAVYDEAGPVEGLLVSRATWTPHVAQDSIGLVLIDLARGVSVNDGRAAVAAVGERYGAGDVQSRAEYVDEQAAGFTQALGIVYVLLGLSVLIALLGIANTLSLSVHERTRELGLLRAVGQAATSLRSMVRWEAGIVSAFGTVGGMGLGLFLAWGLVRDLGADSGIDRLAVPPVQLAVILLIGAVAGLLAGVRPARRASRMRLLDALAAQ